MNNFGLKELYDVSLKLTYPIEIRGRKMEVGESVAVFDRINIANFTEQKVFTPARGGFDNRALVWWEETKEVSFNFVQGVFSQMQFALMNNAKLIESGHEEEIAVNFHERLETNEAGVATTKYNILGSKPIYVYDAKNGDKITDFQYNGNQVILTQAFQEIIVDYYYGYNNGFEMLTIGQSLIKGYLSLEGKTRVKDDITGQVRTGIIRIPKLKLMSNLSIRLGKEANPIVGSFSGIAIPVGLKGEKKVLEIIFLSDDIDSDM